jgi:hypothetical protein
MANYKAMATRVSTTLAKYGAPAVLERVVRGDYDPNVGTVDIDSTQVFNTTAVRGTYRIGEVDGTKIKAGDVRLYVDPTLATEPQPGDVVVFDGARFLVINSSPVKPAAVVVLHDVQARNA